MALGVTKDGKPMIIWVEGPGKCGYTRGKDSCGASLSEMANILSKLDITDAINLDGGGSSQILLGNKRFLNISDRDPVDASESERAIPFGLIVR